MLGLTCALVASSLSGCARPPVPVSEDTAVADESGEAEETPNGEDDEPLPDTVVTDAATAEVAQPSDAGPSDAVAPEEIAPDAGAATVDAGVSRPRLPNPLDVLFGDAGLLGGLPGFTRP